MVTCWQLSMRSPDSGSMKEEARPPSSARFSKSVTLNPSSESAAAAASPAIPPPITMTLFKSPSPYRKAAAQPFLGNNPYLLYGRQACAPAEHIVTLLLDLMNE